MRMFRVWICSSTDFADVVAEGLLGVEYKADCWVFRAVAQRIPTATQQATTALFFQLELNGLSKLGSNPIDALRRNVPGYQNINQSLTQSTTQP